MSLLRSKKSATKRVLARCIDDAPVDISSVSARGMRGRSTLKAFLQVCAGVLIGLIVWELFALFLNSNGSTLGFPSPLQTFERLGEYLFEGRSLYDHSIYEHLWVSIQRLLVAFILATIVGIVLGSILGYFNAIYAIGMVPVAIYQMIPGLAWLPIAILLFGLGDRSAIFIIFAVSSMVITIGVAGAIRMVPPVILNATRMTGAKGPTIFIKVLIPYAAVSIINSLRLGMSSAWRVLIAAEMIVGTGIGLGYSIELTRDLLDYVGAFACITIICLVGLFIDRVVLASGERWMRHRMGIEDEK